MIGIALSTQNLVKRYGRRAALDCFTLSVPQGAILGLVGPNGAGKTTWMMTVAGFLRPSSGKIDLLGRGPFDAHVHSGRFTILPQDSELPMEIPIESLLFRLARQQGLSVAAAKKSVAELLKAVNLADRAKANVRSLSHGMRKRVMLAQCFLGEPEVVLLDEPLNGLDPLEGDRIRRFLLSFKGQRTIVISSHNLNDIEQLCTHVAFVEKGRVVKLGPLGLFTQAAHQVVYSLSREPTDYARLTLARPDATFNWSEERRTLTCIFKEGTVAEINRALLPCLLEQGDVMAVMSGQSLEEAYLHAANVHN